MLCSNQCDLLILVLNVFGHFWLLCVCVHMLSQYVIIFVLHVILCSSDSEGGKESQKQGNGDERDGEE